MGTDALERVVAGDVSGLRDLRGLPPGLSVDSLAARWGPPDLPDDPDAPAWLGDQPFAVRRYRPEGSPATGVQVWHDDGVVVALQLDFPAFDATVLHNALGDPDVVTSSGLGTTNEQWIHATAGVLAHVSRVTGEVVTLFMVAAGSTAALAASPAARAERRRWPRRTGDLPL
jgi:hypothetical protein